MTDVYDHAWTNGPAAPFFEYALISAWLDKAYLHLNRFWLDGDRPVGFVFYEQPVTSTFFVLRPGYEHLAGAMIEYAEAAYPRFEEPRELILLSGQTAFLEEARRRGYLVESEDPDYFFDLRKGALRAPLPDGYHFVDAARIDPLKAAKCLWDGFNSQTLGAFVDWEIPRRNGGRSPHELYQNLLCATIAPSPHATYEHTVILADENEEYACFSGMWWVPENHLAYMEPLCTAPAHQRRGLAAAALSRHDRVLRALGAEILTGGGSDFYQKIGHPDAHHWLHLKKR